MSNMEIEDNSKKSASQIKRLATSKVVTINYDIYDFIRVPRKNKAWDGVLPSCKQHGNKNPKHHGTQRYCMMCKKAGINEHNWKSHRSENCIGKRSYQAPIKEKFGGALGNRSNAVKNYHKTEKK